MTQHVYPNEIEGETPPPLRGKGIDKQTKGTLWMSSYQLALVKPRSTV